MPIKQWLMHGKVRSSNDKHVKFQALYMTRDDARLIG